MKFTIETSKTQEQIVKILRENTFEELSLFNKETDKFFIGEVYEDYFKIKKSDNNKKKKQIYPTIKGAIDDSEFPRKINIQIGSLPLIILYLISLLLGFGIVFYKLYSNNVDIKNYILAGAVFIICIPIMIISFKKESKIAKEKLEELLQ